MNFFGFIIIFDVGVAWMAAGCTADVALSFTAFFAGNSLEKGLL
jgi:hypothetical protein